MSTNPGYKRFNALHRLEMGWLSLTANTLTSNTFNTPITLKVSCAVAAPPPPLPHVRGKCPLGTVGSGHRGSCPGAPCVPTPNPAPPPITAR